MGCGDSKPAAKAPEPSLIVSEVPDSTEYDHLWKLLLIGDQNTGKTSLILRFADDIFKESDNMASLGVDYKMKTLNIDGKIIRLQVWDTAGQERFRTLTASYYRGAHAIGVVFDVSNRKSFDNVTNWLTDVGRYSSPNVDKLLIGNKTDKAATGRVVTTAEAKSLADKHQMPYFETSAKDGSNVAQVFHTMATEVKKRMQ